MASLTKRNGKWQARVRRKGFPTQTKSFTHKNDKSQFDKIKHQAIVSAALGSRKGFLSKVFG